MGLHPVPMKKGLLEFEMACRADGRWNPTTRISVMDGYIIYNGQELESGREEDR